MATYLLYYNVSRPDRNGSRRNAVLACGKDADAARAAANAAAPDGETRAHDDWDSMLLSKSDTVPTPVWFEGTVSEPIQRSRGA